MPELRLDGVEIGGLALERVVVAAHAAHAALGVAGVGHVERREGLERSRSSRADGLGQRLHRRGVERRVPQDGEVVDVERRPVLDPAVDAIAHRDAGPRAGIEARPHVVRIEAEGFH